MNDLILWLSLLFGHWQNWLGGAGLGGFIVLVVYLLERFKGWTMPKFWYALLFIFFFILGSSFMV
jgi:hypothetical protein